MSDSSAASSYLTAEQIESIGALAARTDLAAHMADVVIACAYVTGQEPQAMLALLAESYKIDGETWRTVVAPELAFALGEAPSSAAQDRLPVQARADASGGGARVTWRGLYKHNPERATIPSIIGEAAWEGYAADGHGGQSCERLHERGGFDLSELGYYLARAVDEGRVRIEVVR